MSKSYTSKVGWPDYLVDALIEPITEGDAVETSGKQDFVKPVRETLPTRKALQVAGDVGAHSSIMWPPLPVELVRMQRETLCREGFGGRCAEATLLCRFRRQYAKIPTFLPSSSRFLTLWTKECITWAVQSFLTKPARISG